MLLNQTFLEVYKSMTNVFFGVILFTVRNFDMEKEVLIMFKILCVLVFVICFFTPG